MQDKIKDCIEYVENLQDEWRYNRQDITYAHLAEILNKLKKAEQELDMSETPKYEVRTGSQEGFLAIRPYRAGDELPAVASVLIAL